MNVLDYVWIDLTSMDACYHCIKICFAKTNFPSDDQTLVVLF